MSEPTLEVLEPGLLTTVQDLGRHGYQRYGVPVSGAMDSLALRAANLLVGNEEGAAGLEMTAVGPRLRFLRDTWIAVTGGDLAPMLDGRPMPMWRTVAVRRDSVLTWAGLKDGLRAYLAVHGGIDVPVVMGSRSTYVRGRFGGLEGRPLRAGDVLSTLPVAQGAAPQERSLPPGHSPPTYGHRHEVRVVLGPQDDAFTERGLETFLGSEYTISVRSDRVGYRLEGSAIEHRRGPDIISDGTPNGAVQVPGNGLPIVLLADRGTTGGYAKIATVISADLSRLAQAVPGDTVTFRAVTVQEARQALQVQERFLQAIVQGHVPRFNIVVEGHAFQVVDEEGREVALTDLVEGEGRQWRHRAKATVAGHTFEFEVNVRQVD